MNHKRKMFSNTPMMVKGRPKKQRPKIKESCSALKEKDRPPTRRNPNELIATDKARNTPISKGKRSPLTKYKTTSLCVQTPREKSMLDVEQHEYLQFSLHITEEIIRNDMFKNVEMIHVLKQHYQANKSRLNQEKLLKTIAELCSELNIPMDDNMLLFLDDRGNYSRVCVADQSDGCTPPESPFSFDSNLGHISNNTTTNRNPSSSRHNLQNNGQYALFSHQQNSSQSTEEKTLMLAEPYVMETGASTTDTAFNTLGLRPVESDDGTSKQQPDCLLDTNDMDISKNISHSKDSLIKTYAASDRYGIEVIRSPTELEDLSKAFEFGEETLKAPGEDSIANLHMMEMKLKDIKEFHVLHDATAKFIRESDKESDASIARHVSQLTTLGDTTLSKGDQPVFVMNFNAPARKKEKTLVIAHYATSVEPELVQTKEFSAQATLDQDVNFEVSVPNVTDGNYLNNVSTQKTISFTSDTQESGTPSQTLNGNRLPQNGGPDVDNKCKRCNCDRDNLDRLTEQENEDSTCMTSTEAQYVLLDCPVLIPREHTKSMDFLNSIANRAGAFEKSYHTLNMRMQPTNMNMGLGGGNYYMENSHDLHNSDYYDLTPQKDMFQHKSLTTTISNQNKKQQQQQQQQQQQMPFGCYSCMSTNMPPNKLMTEQYDRVDYMGRTERMDRLDRYKKVNENLSYFYPTIATQVSSMDLLSNDMNLYQQQQQQQRNQGHSNRLQHVQQSQHNQHQQYDPPPQSSRNDRRDKLQYDYSNDSSVSEVNPTTSEIRPPPIPNYNTFTKKTSSKHEKKSSAKINLDNYRIESKPNVPLLSNIGQKRPYGDEVMADRESACSPGQSRGRTPPKSSLRPAHLPRQARQDSESEVSIDKTLETYQSNDSMEKRILSLRHNIEKYSKDDLTTLTTTRTGSDSPRRGDILDILKKNSFNGGVLPSEVSLSRQRKMSILRKQSKEKS